MLNVSGDRAEFVEIITEGKTNCIDGSRIVISKIDDSYIHVSWFSKNIQGVDAYAVLSRSVPAWLKGSWTGLAYQTDNKSTWFVNFVYNEKGNFAKIVYPSLNCSGNWIVEEMKGDKVIFKEIIVSGKPYCIDGSKIVVSKIDDNYISVAWFSSYIDGVDAYATLRKSKK